MRNIGKHCDDRGDYAFVECIKRIPSNCIEVRYKRRRRMMELVSYAVYVQQICHVSHQTTHTLSKSGRNLSPLLAVEQEHNPDLPIHIL